MDKKPLKLVWLCHYSLEHLKGRIALDLSAYNSHPATWIHELATALVEGEEADLHIITVSSQIPVDAIFHSGRLNVYAYSLASGKGVSGRWGKLLRFRARRRLQQKIRDRVRKVSPDVITIHGTEHTFARHTADREIPAMLWMQGVMQVIYKDSQDKVARTLIAHEQSFFRSLRHFVTAQPHIHSLIRKLNPEAVFHPLFYPVNPEAFNLQAKVPVWDLAFSGTLMERKGVEDLLQALALVNKERPQTTACLIGPAESDAYLRYLREMADKLGIAANCNFSGRLKNHSEVLEQVNLARLFVYPSHADTAPLSLAEAMALGKPVIAAMVDGIPAMVEHAHTGILVPPREPEVLAREILRLLAAPEEAAKLGKAAREHALLHFDPGAVARDYLTLCRSLIGSAQGK